MRSGNTEVSSLESANRLSALSIVIDDFDLAKENTTSEASTNNVNKGESNMPEISLYQPQQRPYSRQSSDASIKRILDEAEQRKSEFWRLIDEHNAVIENLKKIEQQETVCKITTPVRT